MFRSKAIIPLGLVAGILFQGTAFASFPDVSASHANYDSVIYIQQKGMVSGYPDGSFRPNQTINRAEFTKILYKSFLDAGAFGDHCGNSVYFSDVNYLEDWFGDYVCEAADRKIIQGYSDGTFRPGQNINFVEAAKIIVKSYNQDFDGTAIDSPWYAPFVAELGQKNAIPTSINSFDQKITRGEMAEMVYRLQVGATNKPSKTYDDLNKQTDPDPDDVDDAHAITDQSCVSQYCHESLVCGPASTASRICSTELRLSDLCTHLQRCGVVNGVCTVITDVRFEQCTRCINRCMMREPVDVFECSKECN